MLSTPLDVVEFVHDFRQQRRNNPALSKTNLMTNYCRRFDALWNMNEAQLKDELLRITKEKIVGDTTNSFTNISDIPENFSQTNKKEWYRYFNSSIDIVRNQIQRVVVVKKMSDPLDFKNLNMHEPWRITMRDDTKFVYNWTCICKETLVKGFCSHIFYAYYTCTAQAVLPSSVYTRSLNRKNKRARGRPKNLIISNALSL